MGSNTNTNLIESILRDLDTIRYLKSYSRLKETLPFLQRVLSRQNFLSEPFWKQNFTAEISMQQMRETIEALSRDAADVSEADLEKIEYPQFLGLVRSSILDGIWQFRQSNKSHSQKKIERALKIVASALFTAGVLLCVVLFAFFGKWGLSADFYKGVNFDEFLLTSNHKTLNFHHYLEMSPYIPGENFSARWSGALLAPADGVYKLSVIADDGIRLTVDDNTLINEWSDHDSVKFSADAVLTKGPHKIQIEYFNRLGNCCLMLSWTKPGAETEEIIPAWNLRSKRP